MIFFAIFVFSDLELKNRVWSFCVHCEQADLENLQVPAGYGLILWVDKVAIEEW